jgi:hypothetical protein
MQIGSPGHKVREGMERKLQAPSADRRPGASRVEREMPTRIPQPDLAESFRWAKEALDAAARDIAAVRRRAGDLARRSG